MMHLTPYSLAHLNGSEPDHLQVLYGSRPPGMCSPYDRTPTCDMHVALGVVVKAEGAGAGGVLRPLPPQQQPGGHPGGRAGWGGVGQGRC